MQYFLDDFFGNFQHLDFIGTRSGPSHLLFITKKLQKIKEKLWNHVLNYYFSYLNVLELRKFSNFDPPNPICLYVLQEFPPNKLGISERFQRILRAWNVGIFGQAFFENIQT